MYVSNYVGYCVVFVGDVVYMVYLFVGQGVNLGFGDVVFFLKVLQKGVEIGYDIGQVNLYWICIILLVVVNVGLFKNQIFDVWY